MATAKNSHRPVRTDAPFSQEVGKTLRHRRLELGIQLDEITAETKIQKRHIKAIEQSDFDNLPHSAQTLGFVRRYAYLLGLDEQTAANKFLLERGPLRDSGSRRPKQKFKSPIIGSRLLGWFVFGGILLGVAAYLIWQITVLASPPRLSITYPPDNQIITHQTIEVTGKTSPGVEIKVDGQIIYVNENGDFSTPITLNPGINVIKVDASNRQRQTTSLETTVFYEQS